ncbi:hypothetical protein C0995_008644 [Termitomyces sp. Mi166|nr:hypothetical protein C0995_008644 [Termitomyces sp. Mi166\
MAMYPDEFTIQETFLDGIPAEMRRVLIHDNNLSLEVNTVTEFLTYVIRYEQSAHTAMHYDQRSSRHAQGHRQPVKVGTFLAKRSEMERNRNPRFVVRPADSDAESNVEEDQEELVNDEEVPPEVKEPGDEDDAESIHIDGDEYVTVDIYDNEYYTREDDEEHLFALTEYQGDRCIKM